MACLAPINLAARWMFDIGMHEDPHQSFRQNIPETALKTVCPTSVLVDSVLHCRVAGRQLQEVRPDPPRTETLQHVVSPANVADSGSARLDMPAKT